MNSPLKSKADIMKFAILASTEQGYKNGIYVQRYNLKKAKKIYKMFDGFDIPDYEKPITEDIINSVKSILERKNKET